MAVEKSQGQAFQRLVDERAGGVDTPEAVLLANAALLIESAEPFQVPTGRKQRVLMRLGKDGVRPRIRWLRPAMVAGILLGGGAIASAALTHWPAWVARSVRQIVVAADDQTARPPAPARRPSLTSLREQPAAEPPVAEPPVAEPAGPARDVWVDRHARRAAVLENPSLVIAATRALRHNHDPRRARALAGRYLAAHPTGALAEEALAIAIEAAIDEHDPDCAALSRRYLELYPRGSFRSNVERGLAGQCVGRDLSADSAPRAR